MTLEVIFNLPWIPASYLNFIEMSDQTFTETKCWGFVFPKSSMSRFSPINAIASTKCFSKKSKISCEDFSFSKFLNGMKSVTVHVLSWFGMNLGLSIDFVRISFSPDSAKLSSWIYPSARCEENLVALRTVHANNNDGTEYPSNKYIFSFILTSLSFDGMHSSMYPCSMYVWL